MKTEVCQALNIVTESLSAKYLGLPAMVGADRSDCIHHLIDRVLTRINGWKEKTLSLGGKEILIKYVAQAIPVYAMMVFRIPKNICNGITNAISHYWWRMMMTIREYVGKNGGRCVCRRLRVAWV